MKHRYVLFSSVRCLLVAAIAIISLVSARAEARWAEPSEATFAINFERQSYKVRKDGTYTQVTEKQIEILTEQARSEQGLFRLVFSAQASKFQLISAETVNGAKSVPVRPGDVEIKPLASSGPGFDLQNQVTIVFPDVGIGSKIRVKYREDVVRAKVPGYFAVHYPLGTNEYLQSFRAHLESEVPLTYAIFDKDQNMKVTAVSPKNLIFELAKPIQRTVVEEDRVRIGAESVVWLAVTSAKSWADIPRSTVMAYEDTMASALPPKLSAILEKAKTAQAPVDQINLVTSEINSKIRYVGDWRPVRGAFHPRSLQAISDSAFGDCKDFTVTTGAVLKRLGFDVHAAWVWRGTDYVESPLDVPAYRFNHAILFATKQGKDYWIDPTNLMSYAQGIYNDISDRPAVLLLPEGSSLRRIPAIDARDGEVRVTMEMDFSSANEIRTSGEFLLGGHAAVSMTGAGLTYSKKNTDYTFISWVTGGAMGLRSWNVGDYDLTSRKVVDLKIPFDYVEQWRPTVTSAGPGYLISGSSMLYPLKLRRDERVSDLRLEDPAIRRREIRVRGRRVRLIKEVACKGESKWFDYSRTLKNESGVTVLTDVLVTKRAWIPVNEVHGAEYAETQEKLINCLQDAVIVFQ